MDPITALLAQIGVSIGAQAIYDLAKSRIRSGDSTKAKLVQAFLEKYPQLEIHGAEVVADKVIGIFAKKGHVIISGTTISASKSIWMKSAPGTKFVFGEGSVSRTKKSEIRVGKRAFMEGQGGAVVEQDEEGNIIFKV